MASPAESDARIFAVWPATTTLYTVIRQGHRLDGPIVATGIVRLRMSDFLRQLLTFRIMGESDPAREAQAIARFGRLFVGTGY